MTELQIFRAVEAISEDLADRRGLKWEWNKIGDDVKLEIKECWAKFIRDASHSDRTVTPAETPAAKLAATLDADE